MSASFARRALAALIVSAALLLGAGCSAIDKRVPPTYDIRGKSAFVVPFRQGNYWHYESTQGNLLGQNLEAALASDCGGLETRRDRPIQEEIRKDLSDPVPWLEYGRRVGVDYLIVGEIEKLDYSSPNMIGMFQGRLRARYEVWDIQEGKRGYVRSVEVKVPENPESGEVYISFEQSKEEIENALMRVTGERIAGHLCGYEKKGR